MTDSNNIIPQEPRESGVSSSNPMSEVELGQWYWVTSTDRDENKYEWLACVMHIGSNFVLLESPRAKHGSQETRVHFKDFWSRLRREHHAELFITRKVAEHQDRGQQLLQAVHDITAALGLQSTKALSDPTKSGQEAGTALAVMSNQVDIKKYELDLKEAKEKTLPELFKEIADNNYELTRWMSAELMPMLAQTEPLKQSISQIEDRIFNVSLYAGLTENVVKCCEGDPAPMAEKLHVMQRRLYMDEECLLNYQAGGMEFKDITQFDQWLCQPENRDRILPFPRTLVAMRVRRRLKDRETHSILDAFINMSLGKSDKFTFLYIRNGDQVWRLDCDLDFKELIFPDRAIYDPSEPMMAKMFCDRVDKLITRREYDTLVAEAKAKRALAEQWQLENPDEDWFRNPYRDHGFSESNWVPFDPSSVYFDEVAKEVTDEIKEYNRIALIIQGLFDRSEVLHPHAPVRTWTAAGSEAAMKLVYDSERTLYYGEAPSFKEYRAACNSQIDEDSIFYGQERFWMKAEAEKENARMDRSRFRVEYRHSTYAPYGNPGPGRLARANKVSTRTQKASFSWHRDKADYSGDQIRCHIQVPFENLFNVSAYVPGDYKKFFQDPRTREQYLKWAPSLLTAEDYHAGKIKVQNPT